MKYVVTIETDDDDAASVHLMMAAAMVKIGVTGASGFNPEGSTAFHIDVTDDDDDPSHGDYSDAEGNLLHVHQDKVVHVTWAKTAKVEHDVDTPVTTWVEEHGVITKLEDKLDG
jgi:hypothetical protein